MVLPPSRSLRTKPAKLSFPKRLLAGTAAIILIFSVWHILARLAGSPVIVPEPLHVLRVAFDLYQKPEFLTAVGSTLLRVLASFALCSLAGAASGLAAGIHPWVAGFFAPLLTVVRATPVLALILIALLWFPSGAVPIFSAFLMAYPVMHTAFATGAAACDPKLLEMAQLFGVPDRTIFASLRLPQAAPHILAGAKNSLGLCWKVVVAGEVLSQPARALGSRMQEARMWLETPSVLAWAAASILLCGMSEWLLGFAARRTLRHAL